MEVRGLVIKRPCKSGNVGRSVKNWKALGGGNTSNSWGARSGQRSAVRSSSGATDWRSWPERYSGVLRQAKVIALGKEGRILPKALRTHAPGGIVIDGIASPHDGFVAAEELISKTDAGLKSRPIPVYACRRTHTALIGN